MRIITFFCFLCFLYTNRLNAQDGVKPNIILIVADDLNDYVGGFDPLPIVETPNFDRISAVGTSFTNAFCSSPLCCPSRTSFLTGKDAEYTNIYSASGYKCVNFSGNFTEEENNATYFTIPGYLKDSAGYFTYGINKIFHCYENFQEYDDATLDPCAKGLSWNKIFVYNDSTIIHPVITEEGVENNEWSSINDTLEPYLMDYVAVDSSIQFIQDFADGTGTCGQPFFLALGIKKPHKPLYVPSKYFHESYIENFSATPFDIPYNFPANAYPPNGIQLPPQPDIPFLDYYNLPENGLGQQMVKGADGNFVEWADSFSPKPVINTEFTDSLTLDILAWSKRSNCVLAYAAAVRYIDTQIGRLLDSLEAYPDVYHNTVIILVGDNGYSLGEKTHWGKRAMWETDIRIPLIVADLRNPVKQITTNTVSMLDIFPTLCSYANVTPPVFPDNSAYLDGADLTEIINNPAILIERPLLSSVKRESNSEGYCFPQYSIRNENFHYIRYQSNGGGTSDCDSSLSYFEEELYEIGTNRNVDPNEWHNLIANTDYQPVVQYLNQWLPGNNMYLLKALKIDINSNITQCILEQSDIIELTTTLYDTTGYIADATDTLLYYWTNNLTDDTIFGISANYYLSAFPTDVFTNHDELFIYFHIEDPSTHNKIGFAHKVFAINNSSTPVIQFNLVGDGQSVNVFDFSISGNYEAMWWSINNDSLFYNTIPGPYTIDTTQTYTFTCFAKYGNNNCVVSLSKEIFAEESPDSDNHQFLIIPNPASYEFTLLNDEIINGDIYIYTLTGQLVKYYPAHENQATIFEINSLELNPGMYLVVYKGKTKTQTSNLIIMH